MIKLSDVTGKRFYILGLGKSGLAAAETLKASGAKVSLWDDNEKARAEATAQKFELENPTDINLTGVEAVIMAPGVPLTHPAPHPIVKRCHEANVPIMGDIDLLYRAHPNATYVGITGTNGKSTTTALVAHILKEAGKKVQVGGNLGTPALTFEPLGSDGIYVLELSSFQLDLMQDNLLKVAVLLNITPDHYDRHGGLNGYIEAKKRIINKSKPQTFIVGIDEPETRDVAKEAHQKRNLTVQEISLTDKVSNGVVARGSQLFVYDDKGGIPIIDMTSVSRLPGMHNAQNACAAFATCRALGISNADIISGIKSFPGLAHRQQFIEEINGVRFINDSKATNADATSKALVCYDNIYWIVGGKPKAGGLNGLENLMKPIRHAFLIGAASDDFAQWLEDKVTYTKCGTLDVAVQAAAQMAWKEKKAKSVVLLSPACASYDQFSGFEERGEKFASFVKKLPLFNSETS